MQGHQIVGTFDKSLLTHCFQRDVIFTYLKMKVNNVTSTKRNSLIVFCQDELTDIGNQSVWMPV